VTPGQETLDAGFKADPTARLTAPLERQVHTPFALILAACFLIHVLMLGILLFEDFFIPGEPNRAEEIPVEIVAEVPPEQKPPLVAQPLPLPDLVTPPVVKEKPPPEKVQLDDVEKAFDAPMSGNASQTQKAEATKETQAPREAPPPKLVAQQPPQEKPEQEKAATAPNENPAEPSPPSEPQKLADDEPDAEALEKAQPEPPAKPNAKKTPQPSKDPPAQGRRVTVAQQLAALAPAPDFSIGAKAKAAPIGGGTEKASYESLLMGLITRKLHLPPEARARQLLHVGRIGLFVDELGNLTHQALYRASGDPALDSAWLAAVRSAAPFPAPPRGLPHGFLLQFSNQN
jgi:periplasmic protein TonB